MYATHTVNILSAFSSLILSLLLSLSLSSPLPLLFHATGKVSAAPFPSKARIEIDDWHYQPTTMQCNAIPLTLLVKIKALLHLCLFHGKFISDIYFPIELNSIILYKNKLIYEGKNFNCKTSIDSLT